MKNELPVKEIADSRYHVNRTVLPDARSVHLALDRAILKLAWRIRHRKAGPYAEYHLDLALQHYWKWQNTLQSRELKRGLEIVHRGLAA